MLSWRWVLSSMHIPACLFFEWCWKPQLCLARKFTRPLLAVAMGGFWFALLFLFRMLFVAVDRVFFRCAPCSLPSAATFCAASSVSVCFSVVWGVVSSTLVPAGFGGSGL